MKSLPFEGFAHHSQIRDLAELRLVPSKGFNRDPRFLGPCLGWVLSSNHCLLSRLRLCRKSALLLRDSLLSFPASNLSEFQNLANDLGKPATCQTWFSTSPFWLSPSLPCCLSSPPENTTAFLDSLQAKALHLDKAQILRGFFASRLELLNASQEKKSTGYQLISPGSSFSGTLVPLALAASTAIPHL